MKNEKPAPHESAAQAAKWDAIARILTIVGLLLAVFIGLIIYQAQDALKQSAPLLLYFFEACVVVLVAGSIYGLFRHRYDMHQAELERYRHNTFRFNPDTIGNYEAYFDAQAGQFVQALPGNMQQLVPQNYAPHYAPQYSYEYKDSSSRMLDEPKQDQDGCQTGLAPSIEEVIEALPRNGYQLCLGRSLTSGELLQIELQDSHIKLIGATRKGKSCLAAALLEQGQRTHDPLALQFALLDLEYKTSRLFERSPHVAYIQAGRRGKVPAIARDANEVALWLQYLYQEMERRYRMTPQQKAQLPYILVYLEEFLDLRRRLKGEVLAEAINNFTSLATRGLKEKIGLMVCAQVDYASEDLRDAMAQFVGANVAFSVKPQAARAAGFIDTELLNRNYAAKIPGQFVVEATGITDLGVSPQFDVKQKLATLAGMIEGANQVQGLDDMPALEALAPSTHGQRTVSAPQNMHADAPAWQAYYEQVYTLYQQGYRNQEQIIEKIWHIKKGGNEKWYACRDIVQQCLAAIKESEAE